jgi:hypothetical protein
MVRKRRDCKRAMEGGRARAAVNSATHPAAMLPPVLPDERRP